LTNCPQWWMFNYVLVIKFLEQMATTYGCKFLLYFEKWNMGLRWQGWKWQVKKKLFAIKCIEYHNRISSCDVHIHKSDNNQYNNQWPKIALDKCTHAI
jgi:hypothetical protein